ncbi:MAG: hypothetical protein ABIZ04_20905 [Opitutus sp.]
MSRRLGLHRVRPALSEAAKAKPQIEAIEAKIRALNRDGIAGPRAYCAAQIERLEAERAWLVMNSMR